MKTLRIAAALLLAQTHVPATNPPAPDPLIVDAHPAPYRPSINLTVNIGKQRFDMRNATIVNMIDFVHGHEDDDGREDPAILGGPTWIDFDRFDIAASIPSLKPADPDAPLQNHGLPSENPYDKMRPIVERILEERFHLKYHTQDRPLPGFIATLAKDGPKLTEAKDPNAPSQCIGATDKKDPTRELLTCTSETIPQFLALFAGTFRHPLIDHTGPTKPYDFTLRLASDQLHSRQDSINAYTAAFAKQLGIVISPGDAPQPAIVVDSVDRVPTPNAPDIAKLVPATPDLEFEVATIKPAADDEPQRGIRLTGSQISLISFTMQELLTRAWEFRTGAMIGNRPDWLVRTRYTILMKLPPGVDARALSQDSDLFDEMLRKLLIDRFQIKFHWGEQTVPDAYALLPGNPKMKKADPTSRTFCKYGPAEGEKDLRGTASPFDGGFHCQNVTMDQFADLLQAVAGSDIKYRVPNKTGLAGAYDFTLFYTSSRRLQTDAAASAVASKLAGDTIAAPSGGTGIAEAFRKQLGLKLEKQPGIYPALILDHIEQIPTKN